MLVEPAVEMQIVREFGGVGIDLVAQGFAHQLVGLVRVDARCRNDHRRQGFFQALVLAQGIEGEPARIQAGNAAAQAGRDFQGKRQAIERLHGHQPIGTAFNAQGFLLNHARPQNGWMILLATKRTVRICPAGPPVLISPMFSMAQPVSWEISPTPVDTVILISGTANPVFCPRHWL